MKNNNFKRGDLVEWKNVIDNPFVQTMGSGPFFIDEVRNSEIPGPINHPQEMKLLNNGDWFNGYWFKLCRR